jgi:hypothetical protein
MSLPLAAARPALLAASFAAVTFLLAPTPAADVAPAPRITPADLDKLALAEVKARAELMKNLRYLSDEIGGRLTGSKNLERANQWTADRMKAYGLENVRLEPWEIPVGWERGKASMRVVEPATKTELLIAAGGWTPGTKGKVTGEVVVLKAKTKADLQNYKGKLKNAVVLLGPPTPVRPITDMTYGPPTGPPAKKDEGKKEEPKKDEVKKEGEQPARAEFQPGRSPDVTEFLKAEGAACVCLDSGKPHGLLVTTGGWPADRAAAEARIPRVYMAHEHYAMLHRLAERGGPPPKVEVEIENRFVPGPITVFNTVGEVVGAEKPDEFVVVGAHLDSWELASGTTDNGTGSCVVLETARTVAALAKAGHRPKRTIRFVLFSGEEQGLHGSKKYVDRHKADMDRHSAALVHDTGTGKVTGFGVLGRESCKAILDVELAGLKAVEGWQGLTAGGIRGGTDHWSYHTAGVPGFACNQEIDEYRLTHHTQSDTFDKAKEPNLVQGAQVMAVTALRIANLPELLPRR